VGRRIKKSVTNSGNFDAVTRYYYDGQKIVETRVGDNPTTYHQQFIHGTQYIDELVMIRVKDKGDLYVHQDANWNVIGLTDLGGHLVERYVLTPYGEVTVYQETGYGDRDGDGDVDATDKGTPGSTCTGTVSGECRILDLDFDGDYDNDDATKFDNLPQGLARHPGRIATAVDQPFAHQGSLYEPEIGSYQNRARQYDPAKRRFVQRDPLITRTVRLPSSAGAWQVCVGTRIGCSEPPRSGSRAGSALAGSGYQDGMNVYGYLRSSPLMGVDPLGTDLWICSGKCLPGEPGYNPLWPDFRYYFTTIAGFPCPNSMACCSLAVGTACNARLLGHAKGQGTYIICMCLNCP